MNTKFIHYNGEKTIYTINENAEIRNSTTNKILKGWIEKRGYRAVSLGIINESGINTFIRKTVHRIMAETFIPNPDNKPQVNHKDGNKLNNNLSNLEWSTNLENYQHARNIGLIKVGDLLSYSTVDNETIHKICKLLDQGYKNIDIINELGLPNDQYGKSLITRVRTGKDWKSISDGYDFIKTGSLKKVPDDLIHQISKDLADGLKLKNINQKLNLSYNENHIEYKRLKALVYDIRTKKSHKHISDQYFKSPII